MVSIVTAILHIIFFCISYKNGDRCQVHKHENVPVIISEIAVTCPKDVVAGDRVVGGK